MKRTRTGTNWNVQNSTKKSSIMVQDIIKESLLLVMEKCLKLEEDFVFGQDGAGYQTRAHYKVQRRQIGYAKPYVYPTTTDSTSMAHYSMRWYFIGRHIRNDEIKNTLYPVEVLLCMFLVPSMCSRPHLFLVDVILNW